MSPKRTIFDVTEGDVFCVPLSDGTAYVGQVVDAGRYILFVVVFDHRVDVPVGAAEALRALQHEPLVASLTFDARFRPGMWDIVTNAQADRRRFLPARTWGFPETGGVRITNFDGSRTRFATAEEAATIPLKTTRSPMVIEEFLLMHAGIQSHEPALEEVRYVPVPSSAELFDE